jgi:hypothetical protein
MAVAIATAVQRRPVVASALPRRRYRALPLPIAVPLAQRGPRRSGAGIRAMRRISIATAMEWAASEVEGAGIMSQF